MADRIRLGFVGANVRASWATRAHYPALLASPDVELTAVCTTRPESAEEVAQVSRLVLQVVRAESLPFGTGGQVRRGHGRHLFTSFGRTEAARVNVRGARQ